MSKAKVELTVIEKAIEDGHFSSMTQLAHSLGYKGSVSSSLTRKFRTLIPDIDARLAANKPAKDAPAEANAQPPAVKPKAVKKATAVKEPAPKKAGKAGFPIPECVPFRPTSDYAKAWSILYAFREKGISRVDFAERYRAWTGKPLKNCEFDCHVVSSPKEDGSAHRSASRALGSYWVERENGWVKLHLVSEKKG